MSGATNVLPAPVIGPPPEEAVALPELSLLDPQAATPRAITPQQEIASIDLREITWFVLLRLFVEGEGPSAGTCSCYGPVADL